MKLPLKQTVALLVAAAFVSPAQDPVIRTSTTQVIVDVVARDKKGKLVRGLKAGDFTVSEDGVKQEIVSVREVAGGITAESNTPGNEPKDAVRVAPDATRPVQLFTLVFDRLGIDSRRIARIAANDFIKEPLADNVYIAIFTCDLYLKPVQRYTNDRALIKAAIERATGGAMTNYAQANDALKLAAGQTVGGAGAADAAASGSRGSGVDGGGLANEQMNRMVNDMLEFAETSVQEQQGRSSIFNLWAIVKEQARFPGRKSVMFFSEGLQVPTSLVGQMRAMTSAANRANVSIYSIDARGLSINEDSQGARDALAVSNAVSRSTYKNTENSAVTRVEANQFDRAMDSIRANPQVNLAEMAENTGGFLIANMNDFRAPLRKVTEELSSYYEIVYKPTNASLDGSFRAIDTKVSQKDVKLQSRNGYFALPSVNGLNVLPYEVPLLKALTTTPLPRGIDFSASVVRGKPTSPGYMSSMIFEMPMKDMTFRSLDPQPAYRTHVSFLALVKDAEGQVVGKISRDLPVEQPKDRLEGFQSGRVIFTRPVKLAPGRYTIEAAAADLEGNKIAARKTALVIPQSNPMKLAMSALTLVRRLDEAPATPDLDDPFIVGKKRVIPTLQDHVPGGEKNALSFFFTVYPGGGDKPKLEIEFFQDDKSLGGGAPELPNPEANGSIPYIATIPLVSFKPGLYEVRVRVKQGTDVAQQTMFLTVD